MSRFKANTIYWITQLIAKMSLELATPDCDHDITSDNFDLLHDFACQNMDAEGFTSESVTFRRDDGHSVTVAVVLHIPDE
jgi:hypothetical protein